MVPQLSSFSSLTRESCQLGKHIRNPFPKRLDPRTKSHFKPVYNDVWGPSRTTSTLGFRYFVTFINDFSICTRLFLIKSRAFVEIQNQFNTSIHILHSDIAFEYLFVPFSSFFSLHEILHQTSCAYTP